MRQFGLVCLAGFVGGSICGFLILILGSAIVDHVQGGTSQPTYVITSSAEGGVAFGGVFGLVAFPLCYYSLLTQVAAPLLFSVTIPSTVVGGWLGTLIMLIPGFVNWIRFASVSWVVDLALIFGPGFLGLLLSSIALRLFVARLPAQSFKRSV